MSYAKQFYVTADFILGYQTINQAIDNSDAIYDAMALTHKTNEDDTGTHDMPLTARDILKYNGASASATGYPSLLSTRSTVIFPTRFSTGVYFFPVSGLSSYWGTATASVTSATPITFIQVEAITSGTPGLMVRTYELGTTAFVLTDFDFWLAIHGER